MQVIYERCAAVDVGKDVIAIAVRGPGKGPDGRVTVKRQYKTFYGVLREAARWLTSEGVTHVAMEATEDYLGPPRHRLPRPVAARFVRFYLRGGGVIYRTVRHADSRPQSSSGRYVSSLRF